MLTRKTAFVLGAGASWPYGFPVGEKLRRELCFPNESDDGPSIVTTLTRECGYSDGSILEFAKAFLRSGQRSIDAFLAKRPQLADVGKLAIAAALCKRENPTDLRKPRENDDWYFELWNALSATATKIEDVPLHLVSVITFNYDRSLEYYFHQAIRYSYDLPDAKAIEHLRRIRIVHVYGELGPYWEHDGKQSWPYDGTLSAQRLIAAKESIEVISEHRMEKSRFQQAQAWLADAQQVCFLGFGFDPLNVERLNVGAVLKSLNKPPQVFASTFDKTPDEKVQIVRFINDGWGDDVVHDVRLRRMAEGGVGQWLKLLDYPNRLALRHTDLFV
jgi:hypothetical protein